MAENKKNPIEFRFSVKTILEEVPDLEEMDLDSLKEYHQELEKVLEKLDASEPRNENSDAYDVWAGEHEDLEDLIDEVLDRIEDMT